MSSNMDIEMSDYTTENTENVSSNIQLETGEDTYYDGDDFEDYDTSTCGDFQNTLYDMLYELTEQNLHHLIDKPCVYFIALFINDSWFLKLEEQKNYVR